MKTLALATAAALTTFSLAAAPADKPAQQQPAATTTAATTTATTTAPASAPAPDSLAAAAARSNAARTKKKAKISITNDNLSKSGGHITSGSTNPAALPPQPPAQMGKTVDEMVAEAEAQKKAYAAQQAKKAEEERQKRLAKASAAEDDNALDANDDPAHVEHNMQQAQQGTPQKTSTVSPEQTAPKPPVD